MTGEVVNLNRVRKARAKAAKSAAAKANRAHFGQTKAERDAQAAATTRRNALLDGARREK